jgi:hypothetical protein
MCAVKAGLHARAEDEHRPGSAVISACAGVLFDAASELAEHHHGDFIAALDALQIFVESPQRFAQSRQQVKPP